MGVARYILLRILTNNVSAGVFVVSHPAPAVFAGQAAWEHRTRPEPGSDVAMPAGKVTDPAGSARKLTCFG